MMQLILCLLLLTIPTTVTMDPISSLENKLLARFDDFQNELLNVKNIIIKNLEEENERLRKRVSFLDKKVISFESRQNMLEQYRRRNTLEITGIPDSVSQKDLENKVVDILNAIGVNVSNDDSEDCHRIGKSQNNSKKQLLHSPTEKLSKTLHNRKKLKTINNAAALLMERAMPFLNKNLSEENKNIAFLCRKPKLEGMIVITYSVIGIFAYHATKLVMEGSKRFLFEHFSDFDFSLEDNENADEGSLANESLQSSY